MEKFILFVLNGTPNVNLTVKKTTKIGDLKRFLSSLLKESKYYKVSFLVNPTSQVNVFDTDRYDKMDLSSVWNNMKDSRLEVTTEERYTDRKEKIKVKQKFLTGVKDVDLKILLNLSYEDMLALCQITNNNIKQLCENVDFWRSKILKDFPKRYSTIKNQELLNLFKTDPKQLYEFINKPSKLWEIKRQDAPILHKKYGNDSESFNDDLDGEDNEPVQILNKELAKYVRKYPVLRGDVFVVTKYAGYRNDGKLIWDGERVVSLEFDPDEYGNAPPELSFPEFPFNHFVKTIDHNNIIFLSPETVKEAISNLRNYDDKYGTYITDNYYKYYFAFNRDYYETETNNKIEEEVYNESKKILFLENIEDSPLIDNFGYESSEERGLGKMWWKFWKKENIY